MKPTNDTSRSNKLYHDTTLSMIISLIIIILISFSMVAFAVEENDDTLANLEKYAEPEMVEGDYAAKLRVTWQAPKAFVDGTDLHPDQIKGYNLFIHKEGEKKMYLGWFGYDFTINPPLEYDFTVTDAGKYCITMTTNTFDHGNSVESEKSCVDYDDEPPFIPRQPPIPLEIKIQIISGSEFDIKVDAETIPIEKPLQQSAP